MSRTLFILNDPPHGTERADNGIRFAGALVKGDDERVRGCGDGTYAIAASDGDRHRRTDHNCTESPAVTCGTPRVGRRKGRIREDQQRQRRSGR